MYVIFVAFGLSSLLASSRPFFEPLQILRIDGWMDGTGCIDLFFYFPLPPSELRTIDGWTLLPYTITAKLTAQSPGSPATQPSELERGAPPWEPQ